MSAAAKSNKGQAPAFAHLLAEAKMSGGPRGRIIGSSRTSPLTLLRPMLDHVLSAWSWLEQRHSGQLAARRLRVAETVSLGEKRFVSILEADGAHYLIGGSAGNVQLLAKLETQNAAVAAMASAREELS